MRFFWLLILLILTITLCWKDPASKDVSRLQVQFPASLYKPRGYRHRDAMFGEIPYGSSLTLPLVHLPTTLCSDEDLPDTSAWARPFALLVDRGDCTFVDKVRRAQLGGASSVLVADNQCLCSDSNCHSVLPCEASEAYMGDSSWNGAGGQSVSIPSFLVNKGEADELKRELGRKDGHVIVEMSWPMPDPDDRVEWGVWLTAPHPPSDQLARGLGLVASALSTSQFFTPYFYLLNGTAMGCATSSAYPPLSFCTSMCSSDGSVCALDPDRDLSSGLSGADVVAEDLRRLCLWEAVGLEDGQGAVWFEYVSRHAGECAGMDFRDAQCSFDLLADLDESLPQTVKACVQREERDGLPAMQDMVRFKQEASVLSIPSVYVNGIPQRGGHSLAGSLTMVCNGILDSARPAACHACSGLASDASTEACLEGTNWDQEASSNPNKNSNNNNNDDSGNSGSVSVGHLLFYMAITLLAMGVGGYAYYQYLQRKMREELRSVLAEYVPLDGSEDGLPPVHHPPRPSPHPSSSSEGIDMTVMA